MGQLYRHMSDESFAFPIRTHQKTREKPGLPRPDMVFANWLPSKKSKCNFCNEL